MIASEPREEGWALVTAIMLMAIMLTMGLALLSIVDTQAQQSGRERINDSAYNLAEGVLNAEAFLLSRSWPDSASASFAGNSANCGTAHQTLSGSLAAPANVTTPGNRVQNVVSQTFTSADYVNGATWTLNVCDDTNASTSWDNGYLNNSAYDANGDLTTTSLRKMWVRAAATVRGRTRAVTSLVSVNQVPALPGKFGVLAGGFSTDIGFTLNGLTNGQIVSSFTSPLLGNHALVNPDTTDSTWRNVGVRCGLLSLLQGQTCLAGVFAALDNTSLGSLGNLLLANNYVQYGSPTAATDDAINSFRRQAKATGTYYSSISSGASCLPAGSSPNNIVFVEQVGTGDQTCVLDTSSSPQAKMLVVGNGRITVSGSSGMFTGVVYALNLQRNTSGDPANEIVKISGPAKVDGAVYVDGQGRVGLYPKLDTSNLIDTLLNCSGLGALICNPLRSLGVQPLLNSLVALVGVPAVLNALVATVNGQTLVQTDKAVVNRVTTYGSSGTVAGTFRQIPAS